VTRDPVTRDAATPDALTVVRSVLFAGVFYVSTVLFLLAALPALVLPHRAMGWILLVAAKPQSAWETFALLPLFDDPSFIIKRELTWIPLYGWYTRKSGMIPVDRAAGRAALLAMTRAARALAEDGRQILIFPEGTRSAPGAPPDYKPGIALLYGELGVPCLPIALNSGHCWPRRSWIRRPGTIVVELLDPIPPGLPKRAFLRQLQETIEPATDRLVAEARGGPPPVGRAGAPDRTVPAPAHGDAPAQVDGASAGS
jgi:1-acyl-sn-glycerol-3-phosphate acyltransferase